MPRVSQSNPKAKSAATPKVGSETRLTGRSNARAKARTAAASKARTATASTRPTTAKTRPIVTKGRPALATAAALAPSPPNLFAGTSGWAYSTWKPGFYPVDVPARNFLHFYASRLTSVEVNYTFRTLPSPTQVRGWLDATPPGFRFSFKAPQRLTHFQRLRVGPESEAVLAQFFAAIEPARAAAKLGPILFQLPPNFAADHDRLEAFLGTATLAGSGLQLAFEFRHTSWFSAATYDLLRAHNVALCVGESDELITPDVATSSFRCYRLRHSGGYSAARLKLFAQRFAELAQQGEVFVFFKHEAEPTGALNAVAMLRRAAALNLTSAAGATSRRSRPSARKGVRA